MSDLPTPIPTRTRCRTDSLRLRFDPDALSVADVARFKALVDAPDQRGCMKWKGHVTHPYGLLTPGQFGFQGARDPARRVAFYIANGPFGQMNIAVSCGNPLCMNPAHMNAVPPEFRLVRYQIEKQRRALDNHHSGSTLKLEVTE